MKVIDLARGWPAPSLLPRAAMSRAFEQASRALARGCDCRCMPAYVLAQLSRARLKLGRLERGRTCRFPGGDAFASKCLRRDGTSEVAKRSVHGQGLRPVRGNGSRIKSAHTLRLA